MHRETTQRILDLMKETFAGGPFKEFYDGDPDQIPTFNLPCLVVDQTKDDTSKGSWGQDDVVDHIIIKVIYNKSDDYTADLDPANTTNKKIRDIVGARDKATGDYLPKTIKYAIRHFATEGLTAVASDLAIEYGMVPRLNGDEGLLTQEAWVQFDVQYAVSVKEY